MRHADSSLTPGEGWAVWIAARRLGRDPVAAWIEAGVIAPFDLTRPDRPAQRGRRPVLDPDQLAALRAETEARERTRRTGPRHDPRQDAGDSQAATRLPGA